MCGGERKVGYGFVVVFRSVLCYEVCLVPVERVPL